MPTTPTMPCCCASPRRWPGGPRCDGTTALELTAEELAERLVALVPPSRARRFPRDCVRSPRLRPHRAWATVRFVAPGSTRGMHYPALGSIHDHWAWFPKPWHLAPEVADS